jgi:hypothetical protein
MSVIAAQLILPILARNGDTGGWVQILVLVVMVVIYGIGSIIKAKAGKSEESDESEPSKPGQKPMLERVESIAKAFEKQFLQHRPQAKQQPEPRRQQQAQRPVARPQPRAVPQRPIPARPVPDMAAQLSSRKTPEPAIATAAKGHLAQSGLRADATAGAGTVLPLLVAGGDPDALAKAILHYEILGRPLSLRDPAQQILGLNISQPF